MNKFDTKLDALIIDIRAHAGCLSSFGPCERQRAGDPCAACQNSAEYTTRTSVIDAVNRSKALLNAWGFEVKEIPVAT